MADTSKRSEGTVKWFNGWKGFGFITPDEENSDDLFVHQTSINFDGYRTLYDGQRVEFDVEIGDDGRNRAANVVVLRSRGIRGGRGGGRSGGRSSVECYNCGRFGHFARDCYHQGGGSGGDGGSGRGGGGGGGGSGGGGNERGRGGYRGRSFIDGGDGVEGYGRGRGGYHGRSVINGGDVGEGYGRGRGGGGRRGGFYGGGRAGEDGGRGGGGRGRGECYNCGEEGHFARDCPNSQN